MKGIINKGIQELVESNYGSEAWEKVKSLAGCDEPFFAISLDYPDETTLSLVKAASDVAGRPIETVLVEYGKFMITNTLKRDYPVYFALAGSSPREFLLSMGRVHLEVTKNIPNATPPQMDCEELPDGRLIMCYRSERELCPVLRGMIHGVGINFNQTLDVKETTCMGKGDPQCTIEVTFP